MKMNIYKNVKVTKTKAIAPIPRLAKQSTKYVELVGLKTYKTMKQEQKCEHYISSPSSPCRIKLTARGFIQPLRHILSATPEGEYWVCGGGGGGTNKSETLTFFKTP